MPIKSDVSSLALLGGPPIFTDPLPIGQLVQPDAARFFLLARECFERRRFSNNGPLVQLLEQRLKTLHHTEHCVAFANAGLALIILLETLADGRQGKVIIPSFTYAGLPHIVRWAGLQPVFCDIHPEWHTLTAESVARVLDDDCLAVLGVHQANSPCPIDALVKLCEDRGVTLLFDSVHGLGADYHGTPLGGFGRAEVFSLHATKILNGFEGGYITTNDADLANVLQRKRNFGFLGEATIDTLGMNAKLNELHAAAALAAIDGLPAVIARNRERIEEYQRAFSGISGLSWIAYSKEHATNYEFPLLRVAPSWRPGRDLLVELLRAEGALARPYYAPPLHRQDDPCHAPLPVAESLAGCIVQMPAGVRTQASDIAKLAELTDFIALNADEICSHIARRTNECA